MKVGDYVRTKNCNMPSLIGKITKEEYMTPCNAEHKYIYLIDDTKDNFWFEEDNILKSSPNIIDLIEVGDYVNGDKICEIIEKGQISIDGEKVKEKCFCVNNNYRFKLYNDEIKNVVTKEQFESIQYNLESEVN